MTTRTRTIKIKVTGTMVKMLKKALPEYDFRLVKMTRREYATQVHYDEYTAHDYGDYDYADDIYKAIKVTYPAEYYACTNYITTKELLDVVKEYDVKDSNDLINALKNAYEI